MRQLIAASSADPVALERLAELELQVGNGTAAETLRRRKRELDEARKRYTHLITGEHPLEHAPELAKLANRLGRTFDARQWASLGHQAGTAGMIETPEHAQEADRLTSPGATLADLLLEPRRSEAASAPSRVESKTAGVQFNDEAESAGLSFVHENGAGAQNRLIPPITASGGVGLLDFDNDGWLDVYVVQGGPFPPGSPASQPGDRLLPQPG